MNTQALTIRQEPADKFAQHALDRETLPWVALFAAAIAALAIGVIEVRALNAQQVEQAASVRATA